jgi:peptidyl-prolyl cis-trans isomerase B (cyclophilin B)
MPSRHSAWVALAPLICGAGLLHARHAFAQPGDDPQIEARLSSTQLQYNVGDAIPVQFTIRNTSNEPVPLFVPGSDPEVADGSFGVGLPISHVFSGEAYAGLTIRNEFQRTWNVAVNYQPPGRTPMFTLAPHSSIGMTLNAVEYYPALKTPGKYWLKWSPYGGSFTSNLLFIQVAPLKQAEIETDQGPMTLEFFYADAPRHVENFIELARKGFYNNLAFHRIESGYFIQGGCPNGDGTGIRPDGVKLKPEFNDRPQTQGMVSMALLDDDPESASCQFFITNTRVPEWDGKYTVFGQLTGDLSYETLEKLMAAETNADGIPRQKLFIRNIKITDAPQPEIPFGLESALRPTQLNASSAGSE